MTLFAYFNFVGFASRALHCPKTPVSSNRLFFSVGANFLDKTQELNAKFLNRINYGNYLLLR